MRKGVCQGLPLTKCPLNPRLWLCHQRSRARYLRLQSMVNSYKLAFAPVSTSALDAERIFGDYALKNEQKVHCYYAGHWKSVVGKRNLPHSADELRCQHPNILFAVEFLIKTFTMSTQRSNFNTSNISCPTSSWGNLGGVWGREDSITVRNSLKARSLLSLRVVVLRALQDLKRFGECMVSD
ncbi:hypothetical protein CDAR_99301 [Caerostris darwini]|uniref:Uncharacterized protein n=1 Tax=Caerostris darwini TaxID=1538125 RepID=A0AAV4Q4I1_9ARAC|nr:hypothetical protein CDAR_99301 [Caerostris darwini]